jgi:putative transposase
LDAAFTGMIRAIIDQHPTFGLHRITALLRRRVARRINRKKVRRIIRHNGRQVWQKPQGKRPRVTGCSSRAAQPNVRWAINTTHLFRSHDGWCHLTAIIDCWDRTIVGWRLPRSGVARVAASALEDALRDRRIDASTGLSLRSDNWFVFGATAFVSVARRYGVSQELRWTVYTLGGTVFGLLIRMSKAAAHPTGVSDCGGLIECSLLPD